MEVVFADGRRPFELQAADDGYFEDLVPNCPGGTRYKLRLDGGESYPDPASRFQPESVHGWSEIVDSTRFGWTDTHWPGVRIQGQVVYEIHVGTFTPEGTWRAAMDKLPCLRDTGITLLEVMPVAAFPGRFGWGYDGVQPYAPVGLYGTPDDMRAFVNRAHELNLGVILDVVYNHMGPDGNYLAKFSETYFSTKHKTDWGPAINFDGPGCEGVREYFCGNAAYWMREFHLDGLRVDATQDIHDDSPVHVLGEMSETARAAAAPRSIVVIGENEPQNTTLLRPVNAGGMGFDALWNDDLHHAAMVALTGRAEAYYSDYKGSPQEFVSAAKYGYLYQGQRYRWQRKRRGSSTVGFPRHAFVNFIQNHDQVANSARGQRVHEVSALGQYKAMTAFVLLLPGTPMLFQGQEFAASSRFLFFADHKPELAEKVRQGRSEFLAQFRSLALPEMQTCLEDPSSPVSFEKSKLDHSEVERHTGIYALHRDLLKLRQTDEVIQKQGADGLDGAVLSEHCWLIRYFSPDFHHDRMLIVNLGPDLEFNPAPEPLLAPPAGSEWEKLWSSEEPAYGGCGMAPLDTEEGWRIPGHAAVVLRPMSARQSSQTQTRENERPLHA